jgi:hypothetical protein
MSRIPNSASKEHDNFNCCMSSEGTCQSLSLHVLRWQSLMRRVLRRNMAVSNIFRSNMAVSNFACLRIGISNAVRPQEKLSICNTACPQEEHGNIECCMFSEVTWAVSNLPVLTWQYIMLHDLSWNMAISNAARSQKEHGYL